MEATLDTYSDPNCTEIFYDANGTSHPVSVQTVVSAGTGQITIQLPVATVTAPFVSLFVGLWNGTEYVARDDGAHAYCYAITP